MFRKLMSDEAGFIISAELMLIISLGFTAAAVGAAAIRDALVNEMNDVSHAVGSVDQTYKVTGFGKDKAVGVHGSTAGFGYDDDGDDCDCKIIEYTDVCGKDDPSTGAASEGNL